MKKVFLVLGIAALFAIIGIGIVAYRGTALDHESRAFVDESLPRILDGWNDEALIAVATPQLLRSASREDLDHVFATYMRLGRLLHYEPATGQATMSYTTKNGSEVTGRYVARAEFENGPASISVLITKRQEKWLIHGLQVNSKVLFHSNQTR